MAEHKRPMKHSPAWKRKVYQACLAIHTKVDNLLGELDGTDLRHVDGDALRDAKRALQRVDADLSRALRGPSAPAKLPRPTIDVETLSRLAFLNSKKLPQAIEDVSDENPKKMVRKEWVGIGWIECGPPTGTETLVVR